MTRRAALWAAVVVGAAAMLAAMIVSAGVRFYTVVTPSMGRTAPVGTLVVTRPADSYRVGDVVTYQREERSYTHRIVEADAEGTFTTKGDLNSAADPLPVSSQEIVGVAVVIAPGLGWLWQGLPWLTVGGLLVYALSLLRRFDKTWRWVVRISGWTLVFCLLAFWLRPWVSLSQLGWSPSEVGGVDMHVVNTGLFPLDVLGSRLVSGQDDTVHVTQQNADGIYTLTPRLGFHWWEQAVLFVLCLIPLALSLLIRREPPVEPTRAIADADHDPSTASRTAAPDSERPDQPRRLILIAALIVAIVASVAVVTFTTTSSALTAIITNSAATAGSRTFFTCRNAVSSSSGSPLVAYALGRSGTLSETDLSGNNYTGTYATTTTTYTSSVGCRNTNGAVTFNGTSQCLYLPSGTVRTSPATFSLEAWFRTSSTSNGTIVGFGSNRTGVLNEENFDRKIYIDRDGRVVFGVYPNTVKIISSPSGTNYADGNWHHVIATLSASTGMRLYLDGNLASSQSSVTTAQSFTGYWKIGCGRLASWRNAATDDAGSTSNDYSGPSYFTGQLQYVAVYNNAFSATQVSEHYLAGAG